MDKSIDDLVVMIYPYDTVGIFSSRTCVPGSRRKGFNMEIASGAAEHGGQDEKQKPPKEVEINVDGATRTIAKGEYVVSALKAALGIPADYELDLVKHNKFEPLDDGATIEVKNGEVFVSHVRRGGSS